MEPTKTIGEFVRDTVNEMATSYIEGMVRIAECYHQCTIKCFTCPNYDRKHRDHLKDRIFCYKKECPPDTVRYTANYIVRTIQED